MTFQVDRFDGAGKQRVALTATTELWGSVDLAAFLNISEATLSRWRKRGVGPGCIHIAGVARYRPETVRAWVESMESRDGRAGAGA